MEFGDLGFSLDIGDMSLDFDFADIGDIGPQRYMRPRASSSPVTENYKNALAMARDIRLHEGFRMFSYISGDFIFGDLIEAMSDEGRWWVDAITIQTLSMSQDNIDSLANVIATDSPSEVKIILSDYWYAHERGSVNGLVNELYDKLDIGDGFHVAFCRTHAKVCTVRTKKGNKIVIHGSANMRSSGNFEQVCIEVDSGLYDFCEGFVDAIIERHDTINHNVGRTRTVSNAALTEISGAK